MVLQPIGAANAGQTAQQNQERALRIWAGAVPPVGMPAETYLRNRGLSHRAVSPALRYRSDTPHPGGGSKRMAMIAAVTNISGSIIAVHRTYITPDGRKADIEPNKASLALIQGGAIRLQPPEPGGWLAIGEGIESSASAGRLLGVLAWSAISSGNLQRSLCLPPEAKRIIIAADPDPPGERAAIAAALRWRSEGREVRIARPDPGKGDFNDLLRERDGG